jgi:diguanylate cyclase (GGDEF)-like protein
VIVTFLLSELQNILTHEKILSRTDFLTGALNRRAFYEIATAEMLKTSRYHHPFTLVYIDIDNFKIVNDKNGYSAGDNLLCTVVRTIRENVRTTDSIARLRGDEFVVLLEANQEAARNIIMRLHKRPLDEMMQNYWSVRSVSGYCLIWLSQKQLMR